MISVKKWSTHMSLQRWRNLSETLTGIWIGLLSTYHLSQEKKHYQLKNQFRFRVGAEIVFDLKWEHIDILFYLRK